MPNGVRALLAEMELMLKDLFCVIRLHIPRTLIDLGSLAAAQTRSRSLLT